MLKRAFDAIGWLGTVLVLAAVAVFFLKPEWQPYSRWLAWGGLVCILLYTLGQWREPAAIAALARIVVLTRGTSPAAGVPVPAGGHVERVATRRIDVSATEVRARVRAGLPLRGFVTDDVAAYIAAQGLYRTTNE